MLIHCRKTNKTSTNMIQPYVNLISIWWWDYKVRQINISEQTMWHMNKPTHTHTHTHYYAHAGRTYTVFMIGKLENESPRHTTNIHTVICMRQYMSANSTIECSVWWICSLIDWIEFARRLHEWCDIQTFKCVITTATDDSTCMIMVISISTLRQFAGAENLLSKLNT